MGFLHTALYWPGILPAGQLCSVCMNRYGFVANGDVCGLTEESGEAEEDRAGAEDEGDRADLSSINAMMSNVMSAGQLNGGRDSASISPAKTPAKSPSVNRAGRKSQVQTYKQTHTHTHTHSFTHTCPSNRITPMMIFVYFLVIPTDACIWNCSQEVSTDHHRNSSICCYQSAL